MPQPIGLIAFEEREKLLRELVESLDNWMQLRNDRVNFHDLTMTFARHSSLGLRYTRVHWRVGVRMLVHGIIEKPTLENLVEPPLSMAFRIVVLKPENSGLMFDNGFVTPFRNQ